MTKSIEEQAQEYAGKRYDKYLGTHISESWSITKANYLAGAKARDAQWQAVVKELREALKKIVKHDKTECPIIGHGTKYEHCSICVADSALDKADQMLKEMNIK